MGAFQSRQGGYSSRTAPDRFRSLQKFLGLRLIHGRADREVFVLCNLPLLGIEVDSLLSLDELLEGGTAVERLVAYARKAWRVLPLSPEFLAEQVPHIATSVRTAKRLVAEIKRATSQIEFYLSFGPFKQANYWLAGQRRPSTAMFFATAGNGAGIAALERMFGKVTVQVAGDASAAEAEPATKPADQENRVVKIEGADLELLVNTATASSDQKAALADAMSRLRARDSGLPNRWPTSKWAREMADKELAGEFGDYMPRLMSPILEINGYVSLLKDSGPVARISGPCKQLPLRVLERMGLSLFTFRREAQ